VAEPTRLVSPVVQAVETAPAAPEDRDWRDIAESLPGATRQLAMQCQRMEHSGQVLRLRLPENQKTLLDNFGDKLKSALSEKLGEGLQVEFELATGGIQSPAVARAREQGARQKQAETAIHADPFVQTLVSECDATVTHIRPLSAAG
jgi:DNA polymerase-3 subunit gamma/tau